MRFVYKGTVDALKDAIRLRAAQLHRDILLEHLQPDVLRIGFLRLGHSSGRFFVANIREQDGNTVLEGTFQNISSTIPDTRSTFQKITQTFFALALAYVFLAWIPWLIWAVFDIPHPWISFLIPAAILLILQLLPLLLREEQSFERADKRFERFMTAVTGGGITVPANSQELYSMLLKTEGLPSLPRFKDDVITWELYDKVYVEAYTNEYDSTINIISKNPLIGSYMHWHPDPEDILTELHALGKAGNILVLRKILFGMETFYIGEPENYQFSPKKKWHWGRLIYLEQKK